MFKVERKELPKDIKREMKLWRQGLWDCNKYIEWHKNLAKERLDFLKEKYGITVHSTKVVSSGWFDGFRQVEAVVETASEKLLKLSWMDSNQDFGVKKCGTCSLSEGDLK